MYLSKVLNLLGLTAAIFCVALSFAAELNAQLPVDVYFIAGQSNAGNIGESNGLGATNVGFNLDFGRIQDRSSLGGTGANDVVDVFSSNLLDSSKAVTQLAVGLHRTNDMAIYSFGRNGRPLANTVDSSDDGESWYPGSDPAAEPSGKYDSELYGAFEIWAEARLTALTNAGKIPNVKGIFWFQGEGDVAIGSMATTVYKDNFENLLVRFRENLGNDLAIVAADITVTGNAATRALQGQVNTALADVAAADQNFSRVSVLDENGAPLTPRFGAGDVHFNDASQLVIVDRWVNASLQIQTVPEPSAIMFSWIALGCLAARRRRVR